MPQKLSSRDNPLVKEYAALCDSAKRRREAGLFPVEGVRLTMDALQSGTHIRTVFFETQALIRHASLAAELKRAGVVLYEITDTVAAKLSRTGTTQGVFCEAGMLDKGFSPDKIDRNGAYLAAEEVQDPGNMGALLRSAEALGFDGVLLSPGCADLYAPKVTRASMGAVFRLSWMRVESLPATIAALSTRGMKTLAAVADRSAEDLTKLDLTGGVVACVGNEGNGLSDALVKACAVRATIPMRGRAESLNAAAAAAILMWEIEKQRG